MVVERAGVLFGESGDAELRHRCRTAPEFVRANIDARRESRGLSPLWPGLSPRHRAARAHAVATIARLKAFLTAHGHRS